MLKIQINLGTSFLLLSLNSLLKLLYSNIVIINLQVGIITTEFQKLIILRCIFINFINIHRYL